MEHLKPGMVSGGCLPCQFAVPKCPPSLLEEKHKMPRHKSMLCLSSPNMKLGFRAVACCAHESARRLGSTGAACIRFARAAGAHSQTGWVWAKPLIGAIAQPHLA